MAKWGPGGLGKHFDMYFAIQNDFGWQFDMYFAMNLSRPELEPKNGTGMAQLYTAANPRTKTRGGHVAKV